MSIASVAARPRVLADAFPATRSRDIALVIGGALLTALCAQITIPLPGDPVPITGQTFAVLLTGAALGSRRGASSMGLYMALGLFLPFYSDGGSGFDVIWGATGGYIVGFIPAAYATGWMAERKLDRNPVSALPAFTIGSMIVFLVGVPWLAVAADVSLAKAIALGFTPFIPGGIVKAVAASGVLPLAWKIAGRPSRRVR
jgi:biotin transport system substrate-specific component